LPAAQDEHVVAPTPLTICELVPGKHDWHVLEPGYAAYVPESQIVHTTCPDCEVNEPAGHDAHETLFD
jgi:hypothetical protein